MNVYVFPGQGAQFPGMGLDAYNSSNKIKELFQEADDILGFSLSKIMFEGSDDELKQTKVTQPAIFLHSIAELTLKDNNIKPDFVSGHSLGEFSALVANKVLSFTDGFNCDWAGQCWRHQEQQQPQQGHQQQPQQQQRQQQPHQQQQ